MRRLAGLLVLAFALLLPAGMAFAQAGGGSVTEQRIQLRFSNTMTDKVDYYLVLADGQPKYIGSVPARTVVDIEARTDQEWVFAVNRKPFQKYRTRPELFQNLTLAPADKQRQPVVTNAYQPPVGAKTTSSADGNAKAADTAVGAAAAVADDGLQWFNMAFEENEDGQDVRKARLIRGVPETDNVQVVATCSSSDGGAASNVILFADVSRQKTGSRVKVRFVAKGLDQTLDGIVIRGDSGEGVEGAVVEFANSGDMWKSFARVSAIQYAIGGEPAVTLQLAGFTTAANAYLRDCRSFGTAQNVAAKAVTDKDSCSAASEIKSTDGGDTVTVTIVNRTNEYRSVDWIDFDGKPVNYASLNSGDSFSIQTSTTHPWMAVDGPGNCIEVFLAKRDGSVIELTRASPGFGDGND